MDNKGEEDMKRLQEKTLFNRRRTDSYIFHWVIRATSVSFIGVYLLITYWLFWPYVPITCDKITILNADKQVAVGDMLWYRADLDKKMNKGLKGDNGKLLL